MGKNYYFNSYLFYLDSSVLFMISIFSLIILLILKSKFLDFFSSLVVTYFSLFFFLFLCFCSNSSFFFLFSLESCVILMMYLIFNYSKDSDKISSFLFMFSMNILGSVPFLYFSWNLNDTFLSCDLLSFNFFSDSFFLFFSFVTLLLFKIPLFLLHFWLTKAHVSSSGAVSMILASLMLKIGTFGILKFSALFFFVSTFFLLDLVSFSFFGSLMMIMIMLRFFDLKYLIACSSVVHMALIAPMTLSGSISGVSSSILMMLGHGLISYFLFFMVTLIYEISINRSIDFNKSLESIYQSFSYMFFIFFLLNLGFPPFINFISEVYSCSFLYSFSFLSFNFFFFNLMVSIFFFIFLLINFFFGKKVIILNKFFNLDLSLYSFSFLFFSFFLPFLYF